MQTIIPEINTEKDEIMENKAFEEELDLTRLFFALIKRVWLILIVAVVGACGAAGYTHFRIAPTYTSTSSMVVLTKETTLTSLADLQLGSQLTKDYTVLITSRPVLETVIDNLGIEMSYKTLKQQISIQNPEDTRILYISVTTNDAKQAKAIVDELASVSALFIGDTLEITPPKIIEEGEVAAVKTGPNLTKNTILGFLGGMVLICAIIIVLELLNDSIRTEEDVEKYLGIPVLAVGPNKEEPKKKNVKKGKVK